MSKNTEDTEVLLEKTWSKDEFIKNKFSNRPISFYIDKTKLFLNVSFYLIILSFLFACINTYKVMTLPQKTSYYISSLDGNLYSNTLNEDKRNKLVKAITTIRQKQASEKK